MKFTFLSAIAICISLSAYSVDSSSHVVRKRSGKAIQAAIDSCAAQGGGVVHLPAGKYVNGPLWLKSGVELHLDGGASLR